MGITSHSGFGYGINLTETQQNLLSEYMVEKFKNLPDYHPFLKSVWFAEKAEELFVYDALEEFYEKVLTIASVDGENGEELLLLAKSTVTDTYSSGVQLAKVGINFTPLAQEREILQELREVVNVKPSWLLYMS